MKLASALRALPLLLVGAACGGAPEASGPPELLYGVEECDRCRMILSEPRYAAAAQAPDGAELAFDDLGCLVRSLDPQAAEGWRAWVHDHSTGEWLTAGEAVYVESPDLPTPMGYGLAAFARRSEAERFGREHQGALLSWQQVLARAGEGTPSTPHRD